MWTGESRKIQRPIWALMSFVSHHKCMSGWFKCSFIYLVLAVVFFIQLNYLSPVEIFSVRVIRSCTSAWWVAFWRATRVQPVWRQHDSILRASMSRVRYTWKFAMSENFVSFLKAMHSFMVTKRLKFNFCFSSYLNPSIFLWNSVCRVFWWRIFIFSRITASRPI